MTLVRFQERLKFILGVGVNRLQRRPDARSERSVVWNIEAREDLCLLLLASCASSTPIPDSFGFDNDSLTR